MSPTITTISSQMDLGEGPHWDEATQSLYFVDIWNSSIHRYVPETNQHTSTKIRIPGQEKKPVSLIIPVKNEKNKFVITYGIDVILITWDSVNDASDYKILSTLTEEDAAITRMNDGKCSPSGVLFAGSMALDQGRVNEKLGNFYVFNNQKPKQLLKEIGISNGLAWTNDEKIFYYIDSVTHNIEGFDYDAENFEIFNRRTSFSIPQRDTEIFLDGMTIDTDGNLWVACYAGSRVWKIDSKTGSILDTILFPTPNITSVAFGGKNLDELYVTSAINQGFISNLKEDDTAAGCTFKVTGTGSKGIAGAPIDLFHTLKN